VSRLVVLGSCGAWPERGRACSGFVVEHDGFRIVLDLGYGTLPRLLSLLGSDTADGLDAVVATHRHPDHVVDLHGLFRARWYGAREGPRLALYAAAGVVELLADLEEGDAEAVATVFDSHPIPGPSYEVGPFSLESCALPHYVPNAGVRLASADLVVAYTGDTGPDAALANLGRDADLYVVDATDRQQRSPSSTSASLDLTAREAGIAAADAGARRLLLTHFWPGNDREQSRADAAAVFPDVLVATEGLDIPLP
jgi:ribonuclease BN (tRNA processing enzyme)